MGRMRDLEVERTDAVEAPASGHKWVILKHEKAPKRKPKKRAVSRQGPDTHIFQPLPEDATIFGRHPVIVEGHNGVEQLIKHGGEPVKKQARASFREHFAQPVDYDGSGDPR